MARADFRCRDAAGRVSCLAALASPNFPKAFLLVVEREQAIARVVALAAVRAGNEAANVHSPPVVIFGDGKGRAATAGDEEHAEFPLCCCLIVGWGAHHRPTSRFTPTANSCRALLGLDGAEPRPPANASRSALDRCQRTLLPPVRLQNLLPQAQRFRRDLDVLILGDKFDSLLKVKVPIRHQ